MNRILDFTALTPEQTRELNSIARYFTKKYSDFIDRYSKRYGDEKYWWALPIVSRNITNTEVFQKICRLKLAVVYIKKFQIKEVIFSSHEEEKCLANYCKKKKWNVDIYNRNGKKHGLRDLVVGLYVYIKELIRWQLIVSKSTDKEKLLENTSIYLVNTPALSGSVHDGQYEDRYFNNIQDIVKEKLYFLPTFSINDGSKIRGIVKNYRSVENYNFIFCEDYLNIRDYFWIVQYWAYCLVNFTRRFYFMDLEVSAIVHEALWEAVRSTSSFRGIQYEQLLKKLKKKNVNVKKLLLWSEGRPGDYYTIKAYNDVFCKGKSIAYCGIPFDTLDMSMSPTIQMDEHGASADIYTYPGDSYEQMARKYGSRARFVIAPILRNRYESKEHIFSEGKPKILFILSGFKEVTGRMLCYANDLQKAYPERYEIILKNHPLNIDDRAEDYLGEKLAFEAEYAVGSLSDCLEKADVAVVYGGWTTTPLEILYANVPLIMLAPLNDLMATCVPESVDPDRYNIVYSKEQFVKLFDDTEKLKCNVNSKNMDFLDNSHFDIFESLIQE